MPSLNICMFGGGGGGNRRFINNDFYNTLRIAGGDYILENIYNFCDVISTGSLLKLSICLQFSY